MKTETRMYRAASIRAAEPIDSGHNSLVGYAAVFDKYSEMISGQFREMISKGAFKKVLKSNPDTKFLVNHDVSMLLARTANGTLTLNEDDKGLAFRVKLPDTQLARDTYELVRTGTMSQCSFSFSVEPGGQVWGEDWEEDPEDNSKRIYFASRKLYEVSALHDASVVTDPAYTETSVSARDIEVPAEIRGRIEALNFGVKIVRDMKPKDPNALTEAEAAAVRAILAE